MFSFQTTLTKGIAYIVKLIFYPKLIQQTTVSIISTNLKLIQNGIDTIFRHLASIPLPYIQKKLLNDMFSNFSRCNRYWLCSEFRFSLCRCWFRWCCCRWCSFRFWFRFCLRFWIIIWFRIRIEIFNCFCNGLLVE